VIVFFAPHSFGERITTTVAGRLGHAARFKNSGAVRSFIGMIPGTDQSGETEGSPRLTSRATGCCAPHCFSPPTRLARRTLSWRASTSAKSWTRATTQLRPSVRSRPPLPAGLQPFCAKASLMRVRDIGGEPVDKQAARRIIAEQFTVPPSVRAARRRVRTSLKQKGRHLDGVRSKAAKPSPPTEATPAGNAIPAAKSA
jgi:Transposase IS116/IS110/IS902 family